MSDASELSPSAGKSVEPHPLDALTGGAFSAETPGERAARLRDWLLTQPAPEQLQEVLNELNAGDKAAVRLVRERLDEIRRTQRQDLKVDEWAAKAQALLQSDKLVLADATAWQREAAKAGAPLSREPLASLKQQLAERVKVIEDVQHKVQVQREVAVLLAQRTEVLSTKSWRDAQQALDGLQQDVQQWQEQAAQLRLDAGWPSVEERFPPLLDNAQTQLLLVWQAFVDALAATEQALSDEAAALPAVPVWADEVRVARGLPSELASSAEPASEGAAGSSGKPRPDPQQKQQAAQAALEPALQALEQAQPQDRAQGIAQVRSLLKQHGRWLDAALAEKIHTQLLAAGDPDGWQPGQADQQRQALLVQVQGLLERPEGQALGGRKLQEHLRQAREQWRQIDQGAAPNHALWKQFDEACTAVHQQVQAWLGRMREQTGQQKASRLALVEELKAWAQAQQGSQDWKEASRALRQFAQRWRDGGHLPDKVFTEVQALWKQTMQAAEAPLRAAQKANIELRQALIAQAEELAAGTGLQVEAVKALQQRWQEQAQAVPLERKQEQKLWEAFRQPLDVLFSRKPTERGRAPSAPLSALDKQVLEAAQAVQAASASGGAERIRAAVAALEAAKQAQAAGAVSVQATAAPAQAGAAEAVDATSATGTDGAEQQPATAPAPAARPVVAVRGDDRPGAAREAATPGGREERKGRRPERGERTGRGGFDRPERPERGPRLGDTAFRAQRDALETAEQALRKLAQQSHGEALDKLLQAWQQRDAQAMPTVQELGRKLQAAGRAAWAQALSAPAQGDAAEALLRLELAADVPSPSAQYNARRALQLQLLTQRHAARPEDTWAQDVASVLAAAHSDASARRLQSVLKTLMRK